MIIELELLKNELCCALYVCEIQAIKLAMRRSNHGNTRKDRSICFSNWRLDIIRWKYKVVFISNDITDLTRKKAILLSSYGTGTYNWSKNLIAPAKPSEKSCIELIRFVNEHQNPVKLSVAVERSRFNRRDIKKYFSKIS